MRKKRTELKTRRAALKAALRKAQTGQSADERKAEREAKQAEKTAERKAAREAKKAEKETAKKAAKAEKPAYDPVATGESAWHERKAAKQAKAKELAAQKAEALVSGAEPEIKPILKPSKKAKTAPLPAKKPVKAA